MKAAISVIFVLFCLLLPSQGGSNDDKNVSTSTKSTCRGCSSCSNGQNGHNGLPGRDGRDGVKGEKGVAGLAGSRGAKGENGMTGPPGPRGGKGENGMTGKPGPRGVKGEIGPNGTDTDHRNWKQCAWKKDDGRDVGLIRDCVFTKKKDDTALRVVFQGNIYLGGCSTCCKRWFITFNGAECSGPLPIDAVNYIRQGGQDNHRPGAIEGYCENIHKGTIRVGINIGNCAGYGNVDGYTGWNSVSRLIIEEVPWSQ